MKGSASVNPMFQTMDISQPQIYSISPLIATDAHRLYFRSSQNSVRWQHKSIINSCYSEKQGALIILSEEGRLHIFTENLQEIARVPWQSKYSVGLQFIDQKNMFLMIGATDVEIQYVKIHSNIRSTKFVSSMNFGIQKKQKYIADSQTKLQWNKGYNYLLKENLLYLWSSKDLNFYNLDNLQLKSRFLSLTRKDLSITYVLYNSNYKYTITGLINGQIKVWRLPQNNPSPNPKDYILIHKYIRHSKQVEKIVEGPDERIIISSSQQMMVCFWSLQTFQLLREYDFQGVYSSIMLYNHIYSLAIKDSQLGKLKFGKTLDFITDITSQIIYIDKHRRQCTMDRNSPVDSIQITLGSNLGFQIRDDQLNVKDLNKIQLEFIYPPLKAKGINQIIASPYVKNQYFLLVQNGEVFRLRIENNSGKIEQSYIIQRTKDVELHQLNQTPTIIKFLPIAPPQFDSQINENTLQKKQKKTTDENEQYLQLKLIAIGCNKGTVVFLRTQNCENIYTRVTYHRQAIIGLDSFRAHGNSYLISYCSEFYLRIIKFDHQKASCLLNVYTNDSISFIRGLEDRMALILRKGFFQIFLLTPEQKDYCIRNSKIYDHQQQILAFDADPEKKLLLTAAADNKIKIWTYCKVLLYEIYMDEGLKNAVWFRPLEILLSHNLKILYFKNIGLKISQKQIQEINETFLQTNDQQSCSIQDIIKILKNLKQQTKFQVLQVSSQKFPQLKMKESKVKRNVSFELRQSIVTQNSPKRIDPILKLSQQKKKRKSYSIPPAEEQVSKPIIPESDREAVRKHLEDIKQLKKQTNQSLLPKIKPKNEDAFDNFMKSKLINKKILTRRDITLNRIIMKNIIKQHFGSDNDVTNNLKLDF